MAAFTTHSHTFQARSVSTAARKAPGRRFSAPQCALKIYTNPASRGKFIEWYVQERGIEAELVNLDMKEKEHKAEDFLQINPFGKVPALTDGDFNLFESGALLLYLAERSGEASTPEARARAAAWILFANSTLSTAVFVEKYRDRSMPDVMGNLDKVLAATEYLEGEFSVADVAVGSILLYIPAFFPDLDLSPYPHILQYMKRLTARPACAATVAQRAAERQQQTAAAST